MVRFATTRNWRACSLLTFLNLRILNENNFLHNFFPVYFSIMTAAQGKPPRSAIPANHGVLGSLPWVERYRPTALNELISHKNILDTCKLCCVIFYSGKNAQLFSPTNFAVQKFLAEDRLPHLLFYGPPGTGKTSTILSIVKQLYEPREVNQLVLELNASDDRGIDIVRNEIVNFVSMRNVFNNKIKLVILDEADAMTKDAQNALRRGTPDF